jgi:putative phosphoesterase
VTDVIGGDVRLAVLGDIHGNLAALDAVLGAIRATRVDAGVCTGDLVLRGLEPEACVSRIALSGWPCVRGNTDHKVATRTPRPATHPASSRVGSRSWTARRLSDASRAYLAELPMTVTVDLGPYRVVVMHASPDDATQALVDETSSHQRLVELAKILQADCVVTGHTHRPFIRTAGGCLFVNPGSVGEPIGSDGLPSWALLEAGPSGVTATLCGVPRSRAAPHAVA